MQTFSQRHVDSWPTIQKDPFFTQLRGPLDLATPTLLDDPTPKATIRHALGTFKCRQQKTQKKHKQNNPSPPYHSFSSPSTPQKKYRISTSVPKKDKRIPAILFQGKVSGNVSVGWSGDVNHSAGRDQKDLHQSFFSLKSDGGCKGRLGRWWEIPRGVYQRNGGMTELFFLMWKQHEREQKEVDICRNFGGAEKSEVVMMGCFWMIGKLCFSFRILSLLHLSCQILQYSWDIWRFSDLPIQQLSCPWYIYVKQWLVGPESVQTEKASPKCPKDQKTISHGIHVWYIIYIMNIYIYLHLPSKSTKCEEIYHTWIVWVWCVPSPWKKILLIMTIHPFIHRIFQ